MMTSVITTVAEEIKRVFVNIMALTRMCLKLFRQATLVYTLRCLEVKGVTRIYRMYGGKHIYL